MPVDESGEPEQGEDLPRVLIVEDDDFVASMLGTILKDVASTERAASAEDAEPMLVAHDWDAVMMDIELTGMSGLEFLEIVKRERPHTATLMLSSHKSFEYAVNAIRAGADDYLTKPVPPDDLRSKIKELVALTESRRAEGRQNVLAIGAHPDDVEIGVGGILQRHAAAGDSIVILTLTGGERGGDTDKRVEESKAAAEFFSADLLFADLPDTSVDEGGATIDAIEKVVEKHNPQTIYTHTSHDVHQDHRNVHRATMVAARNVPRVYCYQAPSSTIDFRPTRFIGIDEYLDGKIEAIKAHMSQAEIRGYLDEELMRATARYWGRFTRSRFVEPLEVVREADLGTPIAGPSPTVAAEEVPTDGA
jgi:LmbE family N-acetylglucosaminyl deacetylase/CheY-like chemotaxis protein